MIKWVGKNTQGNMRWEDEGLGYVGLIQSIEDKYGIDYILDADAVQIGLLELNGENLDDYEVTTDGIGDWDKYVEFSGREGIKELSEEDYRNILELSRGNAYYHDFKTEETLEFYKDGEFIFSYDGYLDELVSFAVSELEALQEEEEEEIVGVDYEEFIESLENKVRDIEDLEEVLDKYSNEGLRIKLK